MLAAIWLTPTPLIDRFVVGPMVDNAFARLPSDHPLSESNVESMHRMLVLQLRIMASVFAGLYMVLRALTSRWRHQGVAS
jgi:hypothetical protein